MAVKFSSVGQIEKVYCFEDAVIEKDMLNGTFGEVTDGVFAPAANGKKAIMQVEVGDDMYFDTYVIPAGSHVRVIDFEALVEQYPKNDKVEIFGNLPVCVVGDKLVSDAEGKLVVGDGAPCFEVVKFIGNKLGVEVKVVME